MAKRKLRGGAMLAPVPAALITVGDEKENNVFTVAWTGIVCTTPPKTYISVRPSRHSYALLQKTREFVIHPTPVKLARAADYCGTFTGAKVDKFEKCALTREASDAVATPRIAECPVAIECRVTDVIPLGTHDMFLADIVSVAVDDALFDDAGKIHMEKADLLAYVHGDYYAVGKQVGKFGFSAAKKKKKKGPSHGTAKD